MNRRLIILAVALIALPCSAQSGQKLETAVRNYRARFAGPFASYAAPITGAPYSARQVMDFVDSLPNGSLQSGRWEEWLFRDSEGRTRCERPMDVTPGSDLKIRLVQIVDPVDGYEYVIDVINRVVHRIKIPPPKPADVSGAPPTAFSIVRDLSRLSLHQDTVWNAIPNTGTEDLGTRLIDGLLVRGVGAKIGGPAGLVLEAWISDNLKVMVFSKRDEAKFHGATKMFDYSPIALDSALFQPPPGYTIVDEQGPFSLDIPIPPHRSPALP